LRRAEAVRLKISDVDTALMLIHVHQGKGSRDRDLPLTEKLLEALREYWRTCKFKPCVYLFPSRFQPIQPERPISDKVVWHACHEAALRAGLTKRIGPHTLRHSEIGLRMASGAAHASVLRLILAPNGNVIDGKVAFGHQLFQMGLLTVGSCEHLANRVARDSSRSDRRNRLCFDCCLESSFAAVIGTMRYGEASANIR
jgi:hypothetical protein